MELLVCRTCKKHLPPTHFYTTRSGRPKTSRCKDCASEYAKAWRNANLDRVRASDRSRTRIRNPERARASSRRYRAKQLAAPDGPCFICGAIGPREIDHNHDCCSRNNHCERCRRGFLCGHCNRGLGFFRDDPALLLKAASYVSSPPGC